VAVVDDEPGAGGALVDRRHVHLLRPRHVLTPKLSENRHRTLRGEAGGGKGSEPRKGTASNWEQLRAGLRKQGMGEREVIG
jgi:hypothetical protein